MRSAILTAFFYSFNRRFGLLLSICTGSGLPALAAALRHMLNLNKGGSPSLPSPPMLRHTTVLLFIFLVLSYLISASDAWFHASSKAISIASTSPYLFPATFGRAINASMCDPATYSSGTVSQLTCGLAIWWQWRECKNTYGGPEGSLKFVCASSCSLHGRPDCDPRPTDHTCERVVYCSNYRRQVNVSNVSVFLFMKQRCLPVFQYHVAMLGTVRLPRLWFERCSSAEVYWKRGVQRNGLPITLCLGRSGEYNFRL